MLTLLFYYKIIKLNIFYVFYLILQVGTAITMTYTTGKPILFVGVGQKYPHLKKLNVKTVVHALLD